MTLVHLAGPCSKRVSENAVTRVWMIRADGGRLYGDFRQKGIAGFGWPQLAHHAKPGMTKKELADLHLSIAPETKERMAVSVESQIWRFINEVKVDDLVVTYSSLLRTCGPWMPGSEMSYRHRRSKVTTRLRPVQPVG